MAEDRPAVGGLGQATGETTASGEGVAPLGEAGVMGKHSLLIAGHQTSISLEAAFWQALKDEASRRGLSVAALVAAIDRGRGAANLSSAIRVHLLAAQRREAADGNQ